MKFLDFLPGSGDSVGEWSWLGVNVLVFANMTNLLTAVMFLCTF